MSSSTSSKHNSSRLHLVVAAIAAIVGLMLLALLVFAAPLLVRFELVAQLWYVLLIAVGLCAAILLFSLFRSWAIYSGKVFNGRLEVGGPAVVLMLIVSFGFWMLPPPTSFDMTVFLQADDIMDKQLLRQGRMRINFEADPRAPAIGEDGAARFYGIPYKLRGHVARVAYDSDKLELVDPKTEIVLDKEPKYVQLRVKKLLFVGTTYDQSMRPIAGARVSLAGLSVLTNADGRFEMSVPADLPEIEKNANITASGFEPQRVSMQPGGNPLELTLSKRKK